MGAHLPPVRVACAPPETTLAELAIAVEFGPDNDRLRDYYDLLYLSRTRRFDGNLVHDAVRRSFEARMAELFLARDDGYWEAGFNQEFATPRRRRAWRECLDGFAPRHPIPDLDEALAEVSAFALPLLNSVRDCRSIGSWVPSAGWGRPRSRPV